MVHLPGKGTGACRVPLIRTSDVLPAMKALVKHREHCGVLNSNVYFFAMPSSHGYVNGWQVMDRVAMDASLSKSKLIHSTQLRKYAATVTQVLSKSGTGKVEKKTSVQAGHITSRQREIPMSIKSLLQKIYNSGKVLASFCFHIVHGA